MHTPGRVLYMEQPQQPGSRHLGKEESLIKKCKVLNTLVLAFTQELCDLGQVSLPL